MSGTVLLTGGGGFLGRRILDSLRERGYDVAAPDLPDFDLLDPTSAERGLRAVAPEWVVHSAAYYGGLGICMEEPANLFYRNVLMAAHLLRACGDVGVRRFLSVGSACAYPGDIDGDMREDDYWNGPLHPSVEAYGFTKKVQQVGVNAFGRQYGMEGRFAVLTNLYGEDDVYQEYRSHVVAALIKKFTDAVAAGADSVACWGTGSPVREFMYVGDAAEAIVRVLESDHAEPLNIGTGVGTTIRELAETISRLTGFAGRIEWGDAAQDGVPRKVLDVTRMREVLGWAPPTELEDGLRRTLEWYLPRKAEADARE